MGLPAHPPRGLAPSLRKLGGSLTVSAPGAEARGRELDLEEMEALLDPTEFLPVAGPSEQADPHPDAPAVARRLPGQAAALRHAVPLAEAAEDSPAGVGLRRYQFQPLDDDPDRCRQLDCVADIQLPLTVELGRTHIAAPAAGHGGSVIVLDQAPHDPVDLLVNGRLIARGEVLVLDDKFCVRITELTPQARRCQAEEEEQPDDESPSAAETQPTGNNHETHEIHERDANTDHH